MIQLDKDSAFVKYWVRLGCTERGFNKLIDGYTDYISKGNGSYESRKVPPGTNLCQLVRINFYAFAKFCFIGWFIGLLIKLISVNPLQFAFGAIGIIATICISFLIAWLIGRSYKAIKHNVSFSDSLPIQYYKALKGKYCPRIEFTEKTDK